MHRFLIPLGGLILASTCPAQSAWSQSQPTTSPSARHLHGMVYDSARQLTVLFGGWSGTTYLDDTWEWDGKIWTKAQPTTSPPPKRNDHATAYDSLRQRTVVFGGWAKGYLADTWEFDGKIWAKMTPAASPSGRLQSAMAYDAARQRTVLFGGLSAGARIADTWEWDGKDWRQIKPATSPQARARHAMVYDSSRRRTLLFGGSNGTHDLADTWEWDGKDWKQLKPAVSPPLRNGHSMAYDPGRQRTILFGGSSVLNRVADTWEWDGASWTQIKISAPPTPRERHAMVHDSNRRRTVLFGGSDGTNFLGDTWEYSGPKLSLTADKSSVSITGGEQKFTLDAGTQHGGRNYWVFGSVTGTSPGINLGGMHFPLNPDFYTDITIAMPNTTILVDTQGKLDPTGKAQAALKVPTVTDTNAIGVVLNHAYLVYDVQSNFHMVSNPVSLMLVAPRDQVLETFQDDKQLDKVASAGSWGSNKVTFGNIGGDGVLGEFNHKNGKDLGSNVFEWSTDGGTTIPAVQALDNKAHTITNGVFNFSTFVLPAGVTVKFVGKNPLQINVCGEIRILGQIQCNGVDLIRDAHKGLVATGEPGSPGGPGGGRGGKGADLADGVANKPNFNGQDGQDAQLPAGHAYTANVSTTGGPGSKQYPADGKQSSIKFSLFNVICAMTTPGGAGGGNLLAGQPGSAQWQDAQGKPNPTLNAEIGAAPKGGTALGWGPVKPGSSKSLEHHQVGGSAGGGAGSHPLGAIVPTSGGTKISYRSGRAGAGGGGAVAIRSGRHLAMASSAVIQARGGNASPNLSNAFSDKEPAPGGGGAGGTIFLQVDGTTDMKGSVDVSGGKGGELKDSPTFGDTITVKGGDGGAGVIRMETVGTLNKTRLGTTTPTAAKDSDVQKLTDKDQLVGMRSLWYAVNLTTQPNYVRYEIRAKVDGNPVVYSDDNKVGGRAARGSTPIIFFVQGAQVKKNTTTEAIEPIANTIKPWRAYVGPFVAGSNLDGDNANGFRFTLILDRSFGKTVEVQRVTIFYTL
ncbi:MAG: Kelch repeat-containing protein [Planctomycetota bacterium]|jgi:hypothetical protein